VVEDRDTRTPYLYYMDFDSDWSRRNLLTGATTALTSPSGIYASTSTGTSVMAWDGNDKIYHARASSSDEWGWYSITTDSWTSGFPAVLPNTGSNDGSNEFLFVPHYMSGRANNRLYTLMNNSEVFYIDLDNDTGGRLGGFAVWTSAGKVDEFSLAASAKLWINRYGRMFLRTGAGADRVDDVSDVFAQIVDGRALYMCRNLNTTGSHTWETVDFNWMPEHVEGLSNSGENYSYYTDAYQSRVRTSVSGDTIYHLIADEDRLIVATIADGFNTICYAGAFEPSSDDDTVGTLTETVTKGFSKKIKLRNVRGEFEVNKGYFIIDVTGDKGYIKEDEIEGSRRRLVHSEQITVTDVVVVEDEPDTVIVTASIRNDYPSGAKLGIDPQPVGVFMDDLHKFQTTNKIPGIYDDLDGSDDAAAQVYSMVQNDEVVRRGNRVERTDSKFVWPSRFGTIEGEGFYIGKEFRGQMKGVYSLTTFTGLTININGEGYLSLRTDAAQTSWAIGPLED
jgi:hypothetical protein